MGETDSSVKLQENVEAMTDAYVKFLKDRADKELWPFLAFRAGAEWAATLFPPTPGVNVPGGM
jgi:hypothetical protein